ncbi:hypothetical protein AVEN_268742-1 [Araneus ventricosus]|uniref:Reverse transcriptase zinc-binding domain-containing protein n=1 Tax=Araneus ventricosus TaxID=182803 RepID=A0A4Y2H1L2_ARAVE|nr:hypothetical protein AVEN_268742-1 [Araneus ventricosus]
MERCLIDFYINQLLASHGAFPFHQGRLFGKNIGCYCNLDEGTVSHYLYGCPIYSNIRKSFFPENSAILDILELVKNCKANVGLKIIIQDLVLKSLEN